MGRAQKIVRHYPFFARSARQFQSHTPRTRLGTMQSGNGRCTCAWQVMLVSAAPAVRVCRLRPPARVCPEALGLQATGGAMRMSVQQRPASHLLVQEGQVTDPARIQQLSSGEKRIGNSVLKLIVDIGGGGRGGESSGLYDASGPKVGEHCLAAHRDQDVGRCGLVDADAAARIRLSSAFELAALCRVCLTGLRSRLRSPALIPVWNFFWTEDISEVRLRFRDDTNP